MNPRLLPLPCPIPSKRTFSARVRRALALLGTVVALVAAPALGSPASPPELVPPPPTARLVPAGEERLEAAAERLNGLRASRQRRAVPQLVLRPAAGNRTGWFGEGRGGRGHPGIDIDGETGDPVWAAGPGRVVIAGAAPAGYGGYGTTVEIDHGGGVTTVYAHLSRVDVVAGRWVEPGDLLGAIGTTGSVTGSHLHFEVRVDGVATDPEEWLPGPATPPAEEPYGPKTWDWRRRIPFSQRS